MRMICCCFVRFCCLRTIGNRAHCRIIWEANAHGVVFHPGLPERETPGCRFVFKVGIDRLRLQVDGEANVKAPDLARYIAHA